MPGGQFGSLNFAILVTCGHSFFLIDFLIVYSFLNTSTIYLPIARTL